MRFRFPYQQRPSAPSPAHPQRTSALRPLIPIRLSHEQRFVDVRTLVDSGADDCLFPLEVAHILKLTLGGEHRYGGIGQGVIAARFATVTLEVGPWTVPLYAGFSDAPSIVPILGQNGFFSLFEVRFNLLRGFIELEEFRVPGA